MKSRWQLALMQMNDARTVRVMLVALALVLTVVAQVAPGGAEVVYACPATGGSGCSGG